MRIEFTESFDSPRYGRLQAGKRREIPKRDAEAYIRDGRARKITKKEEASDV